MEEITTIITSITVAIFAAAIYIRGVNYERHQATLNACNLLQKQVLDHLAKYTVDEINDISKNYCTEKYKITSAYIAWIERFCVEISMRIYKKQYLNLLMIS